MASIFLSPPTPDQKVDSQCCEMCEDMFPFPDKLKKRESIHTGEKPHKLKDELMHKGENPGFEISEKFPAVEKLKKGGSVHTGEKTCKCEQCKMAFEHLGELDWRNREKLGCEIGENKFPAAEMLKDEPMYTGEKPHKLKDGSTHTGEKTYKCDQCDIVFGRFAELHRHNIIHNGIECPQCDKEFYNFGAFQRHILLKCVSFAKPNAFPKLAEALELKRRQGLTQLGNSANNSNLIVLTQLGEDMTKLHI